jgi:hypothetical protein
VTHQDFPLFARPYVLPQRLERGVDILHDPVFNKARRAAASEARPASVYSLR